MSRLKKFLLAFAAFHLVLTFLGGADVAVERWSRALGFYSALSGAGSGYSFFAPGVGGQLRATFDIDGKSVLLVDGKNREADLKIQNIVTRLWDDVKDEKLRRSVTASLAGKILARYPDAKTVVVRVDSYDPPEMSDWREGLRSTWEPFYTAKYARR